jgi:ATP-dependent RNA helicase RhlE
VFTRTKHGADKVVRGLGKDGIAADAIHGDKSQNQRLRALGNFRDGRVRTLVATDIAARGIDVEGVSHVINFDLPNVPESYVHRIGRTARAGAEGVAISLCSQDELPFLRDIEKLIRIAIPATGNAVPARPSGHKPRQSGHKPHQNEGRGRGNGRPQRGDRRAGQKHASSQKPRDNQARPAYNTRDIVQGDNTVDAAKARPVASTQPVGGGIATAAFMQPR